MAKEVPPTRYGIADCSSVVLLWLLVVAPLILTFLVVFVFVFVLFRHLLRHFSRHSLLYFLSSGRRDGRHSGRSFQGHRRSSFARGNQIVVHDDFGLGTFVCEQFPRKRGGR